MARNATTQNADRDRVVIVGASHAGFQLAASLRQAGFDGAVVLIGDEPVLPTSARRCRRIISTARSASICC